MASDFLPDRLTEWLGVLALIVGWTAAASIAWQKLLDKINGLGGRVEKVEALVNVHEGRMDAAEKEISEYRRDLKENAANLGRLEKAVESLSEDIRSGNIALGSQLHAIEKLIQDKDLRTQKRLVRLETVNEIEKKIGIIPKD